MERDEMIMNGTLEDALAKREITAHDRECKGCGECCSMFLPLTMAERMLLPGYVRRNGIEVTFEPILCPLFDRESRTCRIYDRRPLICRTYDCRRHKSAELFIELPDRLKDAELTDMCELLGCYPKEGPWTR